MPEIVEPLFVEVQSVVWYLLYFAGALYLLVPILWMTTVPEARGSVASLMEKIMLGFAVVVVITAVLPLLLLGTSSPYIPHFYRAAALPAAAMLAVSIIMTLITHLWAGRSVRQDFVRHAE